MGCIIAILACTKLLHVAAYENKNSAVSIKMAKTNNRKFPFLTTPPYGTY